MPETVKVVLMILLVAGAFTASLFIAGWKMKRACDFILRDLRQRRAFDPVSAVELPYCRVSYFRFGLRDYRPKALEQLLKQGVVLVTEEGRYYLSDEPLAAAFADSAKPAGV
jgi:hypothetical protein